MRPKRIDSANKITVLVIAVLLLCIVVGMEYLLRRSHPVSGADLGHLYAETAARVTTSSQSIAGKIARDDVELAIKARVFSEVVPGAADTKDEPSTPVNLALSGISYTPEKPLAFVNGRMVTNGAKVDGCEILEIRPDHVRYRGRDGGEHELRIRK